MSGFKMKPINLAGKEIKVDPVCGMEVDTSNPAFQTRHLDKHYYFCSEACKFLFGRIPEKYIQSSQK